MYLSKGRRRGARLGCGCSSRGLGDISSWFWQTFGAPNPDPQTGYSLYDVFKADPAGILYTAATGNLTNRAAVTAAGGDPVAAQMARQAQQQDESLLGSAGSSNLTTYAVLATVVLGAVVVLSN